MSLVPAAPTGFRVKGWHVLAGVTAFFAVVIGVDATFAVIAVRTFPGQVSVTPYEDGLIYNRHIAQMAAQDRMGWRAGAEAEPGQVALSFVDRAGRPLAGLIITGKLERPATQAGRILLRFEDAGRGRYLASTGRLSGAWDLTAEARGPTGGAFVAERRLTWP
ncbi:FixH family protein [uncultured Phenylobacterium sp.]|uniref:FixH family protein n=1 Tax=uncultured Phenylobacterium sp. TaxID=349273 RepID=UPI0025CD2C3A|nr:FixH family protein [uncultured Phenylobacterium sp.]